MLQDDIYPSDVDFNAKEDPQAEDKKSSAQKINKSPTETAEIEQNPAFTHLKLLQGIVRKSVSIYPPKQVTEAFMPRDLGISSIDDYSRFQSDLMIRTKSNNSELPSKTQTDQELLDRHANTVSEEDENDNSIASVSL